MVSWLTHIMGSPGNSIRNRAEICTGDHHSPSQLLTRAASPAGDHGEGLPGMHAQGDLLPVGQGQPPRSWQPAFLAARPPWAARAISATP
jgi:hypothetical protein